MQEQLTQNACILKQGKQTQKTLVPAYRLFVFSGAVHCILLITEKRFWISFQMMRGMEKVLSIYANKGGPDQTAHQDWRESSLDYAK